MAKQRLSRLQKIILAVLKAKDITDWDEFYKVSRPYLKAPYWHTLRDIYVEPVNGDIVGRIAEVGVRNTVKKCFQYIGKNLQDLCFTASFSRSIKGLISKNLIEARRTDKNTQVSEIKLSENGLKVNIQNFNVSNKETTNG